MQTKFFKVVLINVSENKAERLLNEIRSSGIEEAAIIGSFNGNKGKISLG